MPIIIIAIFCGLFASCSKRYEPKNNDQTVNSSNPQENKTISSTLLTSQTLDCPSELNCPQQLMLLGFRSREGDSIQYCHALAIGTNQVKVKDQCLTHNNYTSSKDTYVIFSYENETHTYFAHQSDNLKDGHTLFTLNSSNQFPFSATSNNQFNMNKKIQAWTITRYSETYAEYTKIDCQLSTNRVIDKVLKSIDSYLVTNCFLNIDNIQNYYIFDNQLYYLGNLNSTITSAQKKQLTELSTEYFIEDAYPLMNSTQIMTTKTIKTGEELLNSYQEVPSSFFEEYYDPETTKDINALYPKWNIIASYIVPTFSCYDPSFIDQQSLTDQDPNRYLTYEAISDQTFINQSFDLKFSKQNKKYLALNISFTSNALTIEQILPNGKVQEYVIESCK